MESGDILSRKEGAVAVVTLNRPEKRNAMTGEMTDELNAILDRMARDEEVKALILTGAGGVFCAGGDAMGHANLALEDWRRNMMDRLAGVQRRLFHMEKPTIAMINGMALSGGFAMALACDFRIGSENASFQVGFTRVGVPAQGATGWLLAHTIGLSRAAEVIFHNDTVDAERAERIGLLNRVVPTDKLVEETVAFARRITEMPAVGVRISKMMLHRTLSMDFDTATAMSVVGGALAESTADHQEAIAAFREKRRPIFVGH